MNGEIIFAPIRSTVHHNQIIWQFLIPEKCLVPQNHLSMVGPIGSFPEWSIYKSIYIFEAIL